MANQNKALMEAARITASVRTPTEEYADIWKTLKGHLDAGRISQETYNRALDDARQILPRVQQAHAAHAASVKASQKAAEDAAKQQASLMSQASRITAAARTPVEQYADTWKELKTHLDAGRISQETYDRELEKARQLLPRVQAAQAAENEEMQLAERVTHETRTEMERYTANLSRLDGLLAKNRITQDTHSRATEKLWMSLTKVKDAEREREMTLKRGLDITRAMRTPQEQYNDTVADLTRLLKVGAISYGTFNRAVSAARAQLPDVIARQKQHNQMVEEAKRTIQATLTPLEKYTNRIEQLRVMLKKGVIDQKVFTRAVAQAKAEMTTIDKNFRDVGAGIQRVGHAMQRGGAMMTAAVTVPITAMGYAVVRSTAQFEQAMADLATVANPTITEMMQIEDAAMNLSKALKIDPTEIVNTYAELLRAGIPLEKVLGETGKTAVQFARVGKLDMPIAAKIMADSMVVFNESALNTANVLGSAADASSVSVHEISEAFSQASAVAGNANQSLTDVAAAVAILGRNGIKGSDAGTSLKTMLLRLIAPVDKGRDVLSKYNIEVRDMNQRMRTLPNLIAELRKELGALGQEELDNALFDLFGQDAIRAAQIFMRTGTEGFQEMKDQMSQSLDINEKFNAASQTLMRTWEGFVAALKRMWIAGGGTIQKTLTGILELGTKVADAIATWIEKNPGMAQVATIFLMIAAAAGPVIVAIGTAVAIVGGLAAAIGTFVAAGSTVVLTTFAIIGGIVLWIAEMTALGVAIAAAIYYFVGPDSLSEVWYTVTGAASDFFSTIFGFMANFGTNMKVLLAWLPKNWDKVISDILGLWIGFQASLINNAAVGIRTVVRIFAALIGFFSTLWMRIFNKDFVNALILGIAKAAGIVAKFAEHIYNQMTAAFSGKTFDSAGFMIDLMKDFGQGATGNDIFGTIKRILKEEAGNLTTPFTNFKSSIEEMPEFVYGVGKDTGYAFVSGIQDTYNEVKATVEEQVAEIKKAAEVTPKKVQAIIDKLKEEAATFGMSAAQAKVWRLEHTAGATEAAIAEAKAAATIIDGLEAQKKEAKEAADIMKKAAAAAEKEKDAAEKILSPMEKFKKTREKLLSFYEREMISLDAFNHAMEEASEDLKKEFVVEFRSDGLEALEYGTAKFSKELEKFRALAPIDIAAMVGDIAAPEKKLIDAPHGIVDKVTKVFGKDSPDVPSLSEDEEFLYNLDSKNREAVGASAASSSTGQKKQTDILQRIEENTRPDNRKAVGQKVVIAPANIGGVQ